MADVPEQFEAPYLNFALPKLSMSFGEAAGQLGVSKSMVEQLIRAGLIKPHSLRPGGERRISLFELMRYIRERDAEGV
jgi:excisionase family DNA binding protein